MFEVIKNIGNKLPLLWGFPCLFDIQTCWLFFFSVLLCFLNNCFVFCDEFVIFVALWLFELRMITMTASWALLLPTNVHFWVRSHDQAQWSHFTETAPVQFNRLFKTFASAWSAPPSPVFELRIDKFQRRFGQILERASSAGRSQHKLPIAAKCARGIDPEPQKCWLRIEI